jgi:hypothetical protein
MCDYRRHWPLGVNVFIADQLEVFSSDFAHRLIGGKLLGRTCSLVLIQGSNGLDQHLDVIRAAVVLYGVA